MERNGTPFFVYPDMAKNQIYVGSQKDTRHIGGSVPMAAQARKTN